MFGALNSDSIAWKVAEVACEEGARLVLTNTPMAIRMGEINRLADKCGAEIISADATSLEDLEHLTAKSQEVLGGKIDFVLHSIAMSVNVRKGRAYTDLNYDWLTKGWDISAVSFHKLMQTLYRQDAMAEWGSILGLTYIAAQRVFPGYSDMADNKAYLESVARSFGYHFGKDRKVRVNTISQSPTMTTAGSGVKDFGDFFRYADQISPLGNASAEDCARYCVSLFSDLTRMVTMQHLYHDGGFSTTGISREVMELFRQNNEG